MSRLEIITSSLLTAHSVSYRLRRAWRRPSTRARRRFHSVSFPSADGIGLAGLYGEAPGAHATLIVCHGWPGDKADMLGVAEALCEAGFNALAFDFRNWGESGRGPVTLGHRESQDVVGAVRFLREQHPGRARAIGVAGVSMGAAAAILAAARTPEIGAVVADSSYARLDEAVRHVSRRLWRPLAPLVSSWALRVGRHLAGTPPGRASPLDAIAQISPRPVMIIHGARDRLTDVRSAQLLFRACGHPKTLWIVEGAGHGQARRVRPAEYDQRIADFFRQSLMGTS